MTNKLIELKQLVLAATQGFWRAIGAGISTQIGCADIASVNSKNWQNNAAYIAAASPAKIVEIIDRQIVLEESVSAMEMVLGYIGKISGIVAGDVPSLIAWVDRAKKCIEACEGIRNELLEVLAIANVRPDREEIMAYCWKLKQQNAELEEKNSDLVMQKENYDNAMFAMSAEILRLDAIAADAVESCNRYAEKNGALLEALNEAMQDALISSASLHKLQLAIDSSVVKT